MDKEEGLKASPGVSLHATTQSTLHGWEIMALVEGKSILRRKEENFLKKNGGWINLANDIDAVILLPADLTTSSSLSTTYISFAHNGKLSQKDKIILPLVDQYWKPYTPKLARAEV